MSDLEACYDRQLPESCGLAEESIRVNRKAVKLLTKILPRFDHHAETENGFSIENMEEQMNY